MAHGHNRGGEDGMTTVQYVAATAFSLMPVYLIAVAYLLRTVVLQ